MEAMKVVTKVERKPIMKVELNDRAIEKLKVADFNFTYVAKDGSTKTKSLGFTGLLHFSFLFLKYEKDQKS